MIQLDFYGTLVAASLVLLLGRKLVAHSGALRTYNIPEPVAGGLVVAAVLLAWRQFSGVEVRFDASLQTPLMLAFFAAIGLNANLASLKQGGKTVGVFLGVVVGLLLVQNTLGVAVASALGLDPLMDCWPAPSPCPAATAPAQRGAAPSPTSMAWPRPRNWRWRARLSAWYWAG
ncbi:Glutamate permease [Chromobacterium violaceum]|uniref:Glutamate permease n=1 Tax=Chromobacterium violaceum TaxID=536 RepID=A0A3S4I4R2_CHRVL|nr:Glutamate permease [Chromobacterium violaceum]